MLSGKSADQIVHAFTPNVNYACHSIASFFDSSKYLLHTLISVKIFRLALENLCFSSHAFARHCCVKPDSITLPSGG